MKYLLLAFSFIYCDYIFLYFKDPKYTNFLSQLKYPLLLFGIGLCFHYLIKKNIKKINFTSLLLLIFIPIFISTLVHLIFHL